MLTGHVYTYTAREHHTLQAILGAENGIKKVR